MGLLDCQLQINDLSLDLFQGVMLILPEVVLIDSRTNAQSRLLTMAGTVTMARLLVCLCLIGFLLFADSETKFRDRNGNGCSKVVRLMLNNSVQEVVMLLSYIMI